MSARREVGPRARGALALVGAPAAAPVPAGRFVALAPLREALDRVEPAPLQLATGRRTRSASPRLPHALALHLAHAARAAGSLGVTPEAERLGALLGAEPGHVEGALDLLTRAGVVAAGADGAVRLTPLALGPDPRCAAVDWDAVADATAGSPSAWIAAHALAERLERRGWTPVPRGAVEQALGAGASGARGALDRLAGAGVVERREQRGGVSAYRFAEALWGAAPALGGALGTSAPSPAVATPAAPRVPPAAPAYASPPAPPPAAAAAPAAGLRLVVGGVEVEVPAGMRARVEVGPDGRPTLTLLGA